MSTHLEDWLIERKPGEEGFGKHERFTSSYIQREAFLLIATLGVHTNKYNTRLYTRSTERDERIMSRWKLACPNAFNSIT